MYLEEKELLNTPELIERKSGKPEVGLAAVFLLSPEFLEPWWLVYYGL